MIRTGSCWVMVMGTTACETCCQSFQIRSWADLPHACKSSRLNAFHFRNYRNYFCLPLALSLFFSVKLLIPTMPYPATKSVVHGSWTRGKAANLCYSSRSDAPSCVIAFGNDYPPSTHEHRRQK